MSKEWISTSAGVSMPRLIYGTAWKKERTADLVVQAIEAGFRGFDTACMPKHYHEPGVGEALEIMQQRGVRREDLFVQTKFTPRGAHDATSIPYDPRAPLKEQVLQSFAVSQKNLRISVVDSLVLHSPREVIDQLTEVWGAMELLHGRGVVRQLGISNCYSLQTLKDLCATVKVMPAVVQNRLHAQTGYDKELRAWCTGHGIIYQSFWTLTANPHILDGKIVRALADVHQRTAPEIFFRALTQLGIVPLTGTCDVRHMREDLSIFDFKLAQHEVRQVADLLT